MGDKMRSCSECVHWELSPKSQVCRDCCDVNVRLVGFHPNWEAGSKKEDD